MEFVKHVWHTAQNPILYALPVFFICIAIEAAFFVWVKRPRFDAASL